MRRACGAMPSARGSSPTRYGRKPKARARSSPRRATRPWGLRAASPRPRGRPCARRKRRPPARAARSSGLRAGEVSRPADYGVAAAGKHQLEIVEQPDLAARLRCPFRLLLFGRVRARLLRNPGLFHGGPLDRLAEGHAWRFLPPLLRVLIAIARY